MLGNYYALLFFLETLELDSSAAHSSTSLTIVSFIVTPWMTHLALNLVLNGSGIDTVNLTAFSSDILYTR